MRLIDADALGTINRPIGKAMMFGGEYVYTQTEIDSAPTVDAVPVVRCRKCKHWSRMCDESYLGEPGRGKCRNERFFAFEYGFETEDNFTCADGERKGGDE